MKNSGEICGVEAEKGVMISSPGSIDERFNNIESSLRHIRWMSVIILLLVLILLAK